MCLYCVWMGVLLKKIFKLDCSLIMWTSVNFFAHLLPLNAGVLCRLYLLFFLLSLFFASIMEFNSRLICFKCWSIYLIRFRPLDISRPYWAWSTVRMNSSLLLRIRLLSKRSNILFKISLFSISYSLILSFPIASKSSYWRRVG